MNHGRARQFATGRLRPGERNKLEAAYEAHLEAAKVAGAIAWFRFEGVKLRLADRSFYTPDFFVMNAAGELEAHEVKGNLWQDDARAKIKFAAELYPFRFVAAYAVAKKRGGGWRFEEF